jgi:hypothetical protein
MIHALLILWFHQSWKCQSYIRISHRLINLTLNLFNFQRVYEEGEIVELSLRFHVWKIKDPSVLGCSDKEFEIEDAAGMIKNWCYDYLVQESRYTRTV